MEQERHLWWNLNIAALEQNEGGREREGDMSYQCNECVSHLLVESDTASGTGLFDTVST